MSCNNLFVILGTLRAEMPEISDDTWERIKSGICKQAAGERVYVPAYNKKRSHLETIESAGDDATPRQLSKLLGVSVVHARRLKRLRR